MLKKLNLLFITFLIIFVGIIGIFNYIIDPYDLIFDRHKELHLYDYPIDLFPTVMKMSVKSKYSTLTFGASTANSLFNTSLFPEDHVMITNRYMTFETMQNYVSFFVKNHPELKAVILNIDYASYYFRKIDEFPQINGKNLTIKEMARLFLSIDTTLTSIKKLSKDYKRIFKKERYSNKNFSYDDFSFENLFNKEFSPNNDADDYEYSVFTKRNNKHYLRGLKPDIIEYFDKYIKLFEDNNIDVFYIFPPYHALLQSQIYKDFNYEDIENLKRFFVERTNKPIWDFAYINKYTSEDLNKSHIYIDIIHPYSYKYNFFYCVFTNIKKYKNKDLYIELTKDNIDSVIIKQRKLLEKYVSTNEDEIDKFLKYSINNESIIKYTKEAPNCETY